MKLTILTSLLIFTLPVFASDTPYTSAFNGVKTVDEAYEKYNTIATQIIAQVASSQYGGQTITLAHLAPFVDISRQKLIKDVRNEMAAANIELAEEQILAIAEKRLKEETQ